MVNLKEQPESKSKAMLAGGLVVSIFVCFLAGGLGGAATAGSVDSDWFVNLNKPSWNPPNWLFGPVWSVLYLMMAISAWFVWKQSGFVNAKIALTCFGLHLLLNVLWSQVFFGWQQVGWASVEIVVLWLSIVGTMVLFKSHSIAAAVMLVPYLLWVSFATVLNITIYRLN